jgi:hypothetical protein
MNIVFGSKLLFYRPINSSMALFYTASTKEMFTLRNAIFVEKGIPVLHQKGFVQSPFTTHWYGKDGHIGSIYDLCRLKANSILEIITVYIARGDRWIQVHLNIYELTPAVTSIEELTGREGFYFGTNSDSKMRLRSDDVKGVPLFDFNFMFRNHKIYSYYTAKGLKKRANQLGNRIEKDLLNIDQFVACWHEKHKPNKTNWEGESVN